MNSCRRVAQWATGNIGLKSLRGIIAHPRLTLVGVHAYDPGKVGLDAGDVCGTGAADVPVTGRIEDILATGADCVVYMPRVLDVDDVCRLLEAGSNIVTTCGQFHHPPTMDPSLRQRIEKACTTGQSSIHSTGSSPGFISEAVPLVLASVQRRLDGIVIDEYADLSSRNSPEMLFHIMGFGREQTQFEDVRAGYLRSSFGPSLRLLADAVGLPLDDVVARGELAAAAHDTRIAAGTLPRGSVAAQRITVAGIRDGKELITFRATWYCTADLEPAWEVHDTGWRVSVLGDAPLDVTLRMPMPLEHIAETSPGYTANRAVNLVEAVCAAPPGIRTTLDLPLAGAVFR